MNQAAWHFTHGHSGQVENKDSIYGLQAMGWGLSFHQKADTFNHVHFAVPSNSLYGWRVNYIHLQFTCSENARVTQVHLWDGKYQFHEASLEFQEGEVDVVIDLGGQWEIQRALGVSVRVEAGPEGDGHLLFHAVGANFLL